MTNEPDDEARTILAEAIAACNNLIIHLNTHPDTFPAGIRQAMIEADWMLNSAACDVADLVGEFPPPVEAFLDAVMPTIEGRPGWTR